MKYIYAGQVLKLGILSIDVKSVIKSIRSLKIFKEHLKYIKSYNGSKNHNIIIMLKSININLKYYICKIKNINFMKKITLALSLLTFAFTSNAQENTNYYNFSTFSEPYVDLVSPISMNNGTQWDWDEFGPFNASFPITLFGLEYDQFMFYDDYFSVANSTNTDELYTLLDPVGAYIMDRGYNGGASLSPISYKIEGATGSRILKMEAKNVGFENEDWNDDTLNLFLNFQVWYYEADQSIEFRYGPTNITTADITNYLDTWLPAFGHTNDIDFLNIGYLEGASTTPIYNEVDIDEADELEPVGLNSPVAANTVYRFAVNTLANNDQDKVEFTMFPNPATNVINLTFEENIDNSYSIYDMTGRQVIKGKFNNEQYSQINISELSNGSYVIRIGSTSKKFTKK